MPKKRTPTTLGSRIREARQRKKLSVRDVSIAVDVNEMTVYCWERDRKVPSIKTLRRIAAVLGVRPGQLLDVDG